MKLAQLFVPLAVLALLSGLVVPAIARTRADADRKKSQLNLKQLGIAMHSYHDANNVLPPGNDANNFSAMAKLLPYLEELKVYEQIDFKKSIDDKANADARKAVVKVFISSNDKVASVKAEYGATNYLWNAGSMPSLTDNNGLFYQNSKVKITDITDGTSNTMMAGETLKGDSAAKATTVKRQYVLLKKDDLKDIKDEAGVKDWENNKNIAGDRGASWMDGRFLQCTFTGTRTLNDEKPDVNCAGFGGLSGLRSEDDSTNILMADGSVRSVNAKVKVETWKLLTDKADGNPLPNDF